MDRRNFIQSSSLGLVAFRLGGVQVLLTPREAKAKNVAFQVLSEDEVATLEALGEGLLPGAVEAGIAHFVDSQLAVQADKSLLIIRYFDVPPPYADFYRGGLAAATAAALAAYGRPPRELPAEDLEVLIRSMSQNQLADWQGPPAGLLYFILRNDAVDAVYGTQEGFKKLGFPYQPHIVPPSNW